MRMGVSVVVARPDRRIRREPMLAIPRRRRS
jgi:hypothetical protein